jgi:hypothetical protein
MTRLSEFTAAMLLFIAPAAVHAGGAADERADAFCHAAAPRLPETFNMPPRVTRIVHVMLQRSATFRRQCRRLAAESTLRVRIRFDLRLSDRSMRARTVIYRADARPVLALMSIASTHAPVQWIAHEFEHLVEQLDGLDLRVLEAGRRGVWRSAPDTFETERAIAAGRRVLDEVHAFQRSDNCVE